MNLKQIEIISEAKGIKIKDLADKAEVAFSGLYRAIKENSIKASTLERIAEILEVPISVFFGLGSEIEKEIIDLKKENINQKNYITTLETYLEQNIEHIKQQKDLIDILVEEKKRINLYMESFEKIANANPELKNNIGVKEVVKFLDDSPEHKAILKELYKDDPAGFEEYQNKVIDIINNSKIE